MYGSLHWEEKAWSETFRNHHKEVREYFASRKDYIEIDLIERNKWKVLCEFLNKEIPNTPYPKLHQSKK